MLVCENRCTISFPSALVGNISDMYANNLTIVFNNKSVTNFNRTTAQLVAMDVFIFYAKLYD